LLRYASCPASYWKKVTKLLVAEFPEVCFTLKSGHWSARPWCPL